MSEIKLISPMLNGFAIGDPISDHNGVRSCPAMHETTEDKYIVKIISTPASSVQLDALLLSGAYSSKEDALSYYETVAKETEEEVAVLKKLAEYDGFLPFEDHQLIPMDDGCGYDLYLLSRYKKSLARCFQKETMTHLGALNLGLDICAALTICRRSGYIYANLKPENIYLNKENSYRIGDIGFLKLDSLKYASLPDRYRSAYTAPELTDPIATLNTTIDVYAVGLILYQAFNGGVLPTIEEGEPLAAPDYADYEMAEIILKACAVDPADRYEDPAQMGHALVGYMQRNGAHDTPIVPPVVPEPEAAEPEVIEEEEILEEVAEEAVAEESADVDEQIVQEETSAASNFIPEEEDETLPGTDCEDLVLEDVSEEVSDMLTQADELISHPTPEPVVAPEPVEITIPEPAAEAEEASEEATEAQDEEKVVEADGEDEPENQEDAEDQATDTEGAEVEEESEETEETEDPAQEQAANVSGWFDEDDLDDEKPKHRWVGWLITVILIAALIVAGIFYYNRIYVQTIDQLTLTGDGNTLTVQLTTSVNEKLLTVVCADTHGTPHSAPVVNGKATFKNLEYGVPYSITVTIDGFHKLNGKTTAEYATPKLTRITGITAVTGREDGSLILNFTVEGPDADKWLVTYSAADQQPQAIETAEHSAEIFGLNIGSDYTIEITPAEDIEFEPINNKIAHTARRSVLAENLYISNYANDTVTVTWQVPDEADVLTWDVWCHDTNENGYSENISTQLPTATFSGVTPADSYHIEIRATGMYDAATIEIPANPTSIQNVQTEYVNGSTVITWETGDYASEVNWILEDMNTNKTYTGTTENRMQIDTLLPGTEYRFLLKTGDKEVDDLIVGNILTCKTPDKVDFEGYGVSRSDLSYSMCRTPAEEDWDDDYLLRSDYTTKFPVGRNGSILAEFGYYIERSQDSILILYVVKDADGNVVSANAQTEIWNDMWYWYGKRGMGTFDLPEMPDAVGTYTFELYFNGAAVLSQEFTITQ